MAKVSIATRKKTKQTKKKKFSRVASAYLDVGKVADEGGEVRLEGVLELLLVLVAELTGEHVGDTLSVFDEDNRGSGRGKASASQCRRSAVFLVFLVFFSPPGVPRRGLVAAAAATR